MISADKLNHLKSQLEGDFFADNVQRVLYSTDASQYKEMPVAVTRPKNKEDIKKSLHLHAKTALQLFRAAPGHHWPDRWLGQALLSIFRNT